MLEAKLAEAQTLKKLLEAIKELVSDANFQCGEEGITLQAMDNSHVALVSVELERAGFAKYRCDRPIPLGVNLNSLTKILKCAKDDDVCTLKASDDADTLNLTYEAKNADRISDYELKLMDIDSDTLGIPDTEYDVCVSMPSGEFARIVRDLSALGESVKIDVSKDGVRFTAEGEAANGNILLKQTANARRRSKHVGKEKEKETAKVKKEGGGEDDEEDEPESEEESSKKKKKTKVKREEGGSDVEMVDDDDDDDEAKPDEDEDEDEEDSESASKKRKKGPSKSSKPSKRAKKSDDDEEENEGGVSIDMNQAVSLTFSLKYLVNFSKSTSLSRQVQLMMSADVPLLVAYQFTQGKIHYYLAPKIGDD